MVILGINLNDKTMGVGFKLINNHTLYYVFSRYKSLRSVVKKSLFPNYGRCIVLMEVY